MKKGRAQVRGEELLQKLLNQTMEQVPPILRKPLFQYVNLSLTNIPPSEFDKILDGFLNVAEELYTLREQDRKEILVNAG
jgi:hypothetical protein